MELRQAACDKLLLDRVDAKLRGKKIGSVANRFLNPTSFPTML